MAFDFPTLWPLGTVCPCRGRELSLCLQMPPSRHSCSVHTATGTFLPTDSLSLEGIADGCRIPLEQIVSPPRGGGKVGQPFESGNELTPQALLPLKLMLS